MKSSAKMNHKQWFGFFAYWKQSEYQIPIVDIKKQSILRTVSLSRIFNITAPQRNATNRNKELFVYTF